MRLQSLRSSLDCWLRLVVAIALSVAGCLVTCALPSGASAPASAHAYTYDDIEQLSLRTHVWLVRAVPASTGFRTLPATSGLRPSLDVDTGSAAEGGSALEQGAAKVPSAWGDGAANTKGVGTKWSDPSEPQANRIRIDDGVPGSAWPRQQVDHVVVHSGGRILGPDGEPIVGSLRDNPQAHIPLSDWLNWSSWNAP